ncbi:MAG: tetratricopeptide repeat protein [Aureispira sp.]
MSPSKMPYQIRALNNIAFCYSQLGDAVQAKKYYQQALQLFPENGVATAALRLLEAKANSSASNTAKH